MAPVQVRNNVESCSYSQEKFKLVKWSLLVTLETQTPYFEKSFKVEEDCECHLQGQIFKTMEWQSIGMWKNTEFNNISHKIFIDEMLIYHDIKVFNCKSFYLSLLIIGILKEISNSYLLKFNYVYTCIYLVLVVHIFVCYMIKLTSA